MQLISIGVSNALKLDGENLKHGLKSLSEKGIKVAVNSSVCGPVTYYNLKIEDKPTFNNIAKIRNYIAEAISDIIVNQIDKRIIRKLINKYYYYFTESEKEQIEKIAYNIIEDDVNRETFKLIKREQIFVLVRDFLKENDYIDIEGFVNFRLRDFIGELSEITDKAVDEFLMQREYNEFIGLLKYFVELQDSKMDVLNIVVDKNGKFKLYNENHELVNSDFINEISLEFKDGTISDEDMLMSTIITIAPKKIFFHSINNIKNKEIIETIKKVFYDRVEICYGCELCSNIKCEK
ncbi:sporulation protein YtxC [Thermoanaerobacter kivui]|uniref:Sporulation protein YtxC n=1 Tax=Thermoanaerobacter kivui TaxID=2325 RepID=A0A097ASG1_THEKI|nr:putative sporulation protein YtxC [Thermoanaerobacter kivui]AIS52758.1 sporulation protein YtxC [Thermoanaerobacter kivui]